MKKLIKRIFFTGFLFTIFFFAPTYISNAEEMDQLYEVDTSQLNMRTGPTHEADIVGQLVDGDRLRIFEEKNGWVKTFYRGEPVWVSGNYLVYIEEEPQPQQEAETSEPEEEKATEQTEDEKSDDDVEDKNNKQSETEKEENSNQTNERKFTREYFRLPDIFGSEQLYADTPEEQETQSAEEINEEPAREEQISEQAFEISDELLSNYNIVIDPGHGGNDAGATSSGVLEKELTLSTAEKVMERLQQAGASVQLTRENDEFISLDQRVQLSNGQDTDAYISLHFDSFNDPSVNGINTYYYHDQKSLGLAKTIHANLTEHVEMNDRGIRKTGFLVLRKNENPALLLELGFMTNPDNLATIQTEDYQNRVADAITDGLLDYFSKE